MKFSVGQRVRVVMDAFDEAFVGAVGLIKESVGDEADYPYIVEFDHPIDGDTERDFGEDEIVAFNVTVIEGVANSDGCIVDDDALVIVMMKMSDAHKRFRITIEEVDDHA